MTDDRAELLAECDALAFEATDARNDLVAVTEDLDVLMEWLLEHAIDVLEQMPEDLRLRLGENRRKLEKKRDIDN